MSTPDTDFYNVVLHVGATVNGKVITLQEAIPARHWGTLTPDAKEGIKSMLRRELGVAIGTSVDFPVTVTRGEHQVMTTGAAAPGHDGSCAHVSDLVRDAVLNDGAAAVFGLDFDLKRDGYEFDSHRQAWELGTIDAAKHLRSMTARPVDQEASVARLERGREQLVEAMSLVSKKRYWAEWERNLDRSLHSEGGMWEILGRTVGWPVGEWKPLTWMSWDDAGALYASRPAPGE
jgi:hypothetical protein